MNDRSLQEAVTDELEYEPSVNAAHIGVSTNSGVVTLTGHVDSYTQKLAAEMAAGRVTGVKAIAEELEVRYPFDPPDDSDIAKNALQALSCDFEVPKDSVTAAFARNAQIHADNIIVTAHGGKVTLTGNVDSWHQRELAETTAWSAPGVTQVDDRLSII